MGEGVEEGEARHLLPLIPLVMPMDYTPWSVVTFTLTAVSDPTLYGQCYLGSGLYSSIKMYTLIRPALNCKVKSVCMYSKCAGQSILSFCMYY